MQTLTFLFAFIAVLALIGVAAWLVRRFANNRIGANTQRGRMPRLAVIDAAAVDGRRRLVLVRRDNVEHLLMIGGPSDIVVEPNIVRAMPGRDMAPRPAVGEQPPRIAPLPDAVWSDEATKTEARSTDAFEPAEPQMPEPPPRPARPAFADELRRPVPPPMAERRSDQLTGFSPESLGARTEPVPPRMPRAEPMMPRPQRAGEPPKPPSREAPSREAPSREAPPRDVVLPVRPPERVAAPPPPPPPPAPPPAPAPSSADQNLAEMAQRLEAALRRPGKTEEPRFAAAPEPAGAETEDYPPPPPHSRAPAAAEARPARGEPRPGRADGKAPAGKSLYDSLEQEMASLLGRPEKKT
jgi:flagellar protein FliO/FliZ